MIELKQKQMSAFIDVAASIEPGRMSGLAAHPRRRFVRVGM